MLRHEYVYYAQQFNWGIDNAGITTKWTLRLDADERFTPEVCARCEALLSEHTEDDVNGVVMESDFFFLGRLMKHGGSKKRKIMLFKTGKGRIEDRRRGRAYDPFSRARARRPRAVPALRPQGFDELH